MFSDDELNSALKIAWFIAKRCQNQKTSSHRTFDLIATCFNIFFERVNDVQLINKNELQFYSEIYGFFLLWESRERPLCTFPLILSFDKGASTCRGFHFKGKVRKREKRKIHCTHHNLLFFYEPLASSSHSSRNQFNIFFSWVQRKLIDKWTRRLEDSCEWSLKWWDDGVNDIKEHKIAIYGQGTSL